MQQAVRGGMTPIQLRKWTNAAASSLLLLLMQFDEPDEQGYELSRVLLPHVISVAEQAESNVPKPVHNMFQANWPAWKSWRESARSLYVIAWQLFGHGELQEAETLALRAIDLLERSYPAARGFYPDESAPWVFALCEAFTCAAVCSLNLRRFKAARSYLERGKQLAASRKVLNLQGYMLVGIVVVSLEGGELKAARTAVDEAQALKSRKGMDREILEQIDEARARLEDVERKASEKKTRKSRKKPRKNR